jgi:hypothetical protein
MCTWKIERTEAYWYCRFAVVTQQGAVLFHHCSNKKSNSAIIADKMMIDDFV